MSLHQISSQSASSDTAIDLPQCEKLDHNKLLHPRLPQSCSSPATPVLSLSGLTASFSYKTNSHLEKKERVDDNRNMPSDTCSVKYQPPVKESDESFTNLTHDTGINSQHSPPDTPYSKNSEQFCQNCKNKIPDDIDVSLPSPVYFYDFLAECPSPWLHYGYCTPCIVMARFINKTNITDHIAQCPAFLDMCWEGEHESLIAEYKQKEAEFGKDT